MARMKTIRLLILAVALALTAIVSVSANPDTPVLINPGFECDDGYHPQAGIRGLIPNGWTAQLLAGDPDLVSTRMRFYYVCDHDPDNFVDRLEGYDSFIFAAQDIETPPEPGKPFDALIYQQVAVTPGVAYSLSGWMVSLCGGSAMPNDCPPGYYMAKMIGLDPTGGTDPLAGSVTWVEDRRNFTETRWLNMQLAARAGGPLLTVFARIRSPYRWHGNHAFADAFSIVRAPSAQIVGLPATQPGRQVEVRWQGDLGPDIPAIPNGKYSMLFDVQYRPAGRVGRLAHRAARRRGDLHGPGVRRFHLFVSRPSPRRATRRRRRVAQSPLPRRLERPRHGYVHTGRSLRLPRLPSHSPALTRRVNLQGRGCPALSPRALSRPPQPATSPPTRRWPNRRLPTLGLRCG